MSISSALKTPLNDAQIRALIRAAQQGDLDAREKVILAYLPLAQTYAQKYQGLGVPYDDLYQEACFGLIAAIPHYDPNRNEKFATLASHYIARSIRHYAIPKQNSTIPNCYNEDFYNEIKSFQSGLESFKNIYGREPSDAEISKHLNISLLRTRRLKLASSAFLCPTHDFDFENYAEDITARPVEDEVLKRAGCSGLLDANVALTPREKEVLERRCGFTSSGEPETWALISAEMGLHIETLRLAYNSAIAKLRRAVDVAP